MRLDGGDGAAARAEETVGERDSHFPGCIRAERYAAGRIEPEPGSPERGQRLGVDIVAFESSDVVVDGGVLEQRAEPLGRDRGSEALGVRDVAD